MSFLRLIGWLLVALTLTILPLPEPIVAFRPPWLLLLVLYTQFMLPNYFSTVVLVFLGLWLDTLLSTVLGEHAFALLSVTWLASSKARRFQFFSMGQQMLWVGLLSLFYQIILMGIDLSLGFSGRLLPAVGSAFLSLLLWPWIRVALDSLLLTPRLRR